MERGAWTVRDAVRPTPRVLPLVHNFVIFRFLHAPRFTVHGPRIPFFRWSTTSRFSDFFPASRSPLHAPRSRLLAPRSPPCSTPHASRSPPASRSTLHAPRSTPHVLPLGPRPTPHAPRSTVHAPRITPHVLPLLHAPRSTLHAPRSTVLFPSMMRFPAAGFNGQNWPPPGREGERPSAERLMLDYDAEAELGARQAVVEIAQRCALRLAWSSGMRAGAFKGRQPESLRREEWGQTCAFVTKSHRQALT